MRAFAAIAMLAGCDRLFDVAPLAVVDGESGSGGDARARCALGTPTIPNAGFGANTLSYTTNATNVAGFAEVAGVTNGFSYLPAGKQPTSNVLLVDPSHSLHYPRMSPEADEVFLQSTPNAGGPPTIRRYTTPDAWMTWGDTTLSIDSQTAVAASFIPGVPTSRDASAQRHMLVDLGGGTFAELVETAVDQWITRRMYTSLSLGIGGVVELPALTADGLRAVFLVNASTFAIATASRQTIDDPLVTERPVWLVAPNGVTMPFLSADCTTLYFSDASFEVFAAPVR